MIRQRTPPHEVDDDVSRPCAGCSVERWNAATVRRRRPGRPGRDRRDRRDRRSALTGRSRRCQSFPVRHHPTRRCDWQDGTSWTRSGTVPRSGKLQNRGLRSTHRSSKADCGTDVVNGLAPPASASRRRHRRLSGCRRTAERHRRRYPTGFDRTALRVLASADGSVAAMVLQSAVSIQKQAADFEHASGWRTRAPG